MQIARDEEVERLLEQYWNAARRDREVTEAVQSTGRDQEEGKEATSSSTDELKDFIITSFKKQDRKLTKIRNELARMDSMEQRLERMESTLDRILTHLNIPGEEEVKDRDEIDGSSTESDGNRRPLIMEAVEIVRPAVRPAWLK